MDELLELLSELSGDGVVDQGHGSSIRGVRERSRRRARG
jgi:hypothetical protein